MQLAETASEHALAQEVRSFLAREGFDATELPRALDERMGVLRRWQAACYEAGFVGRAWPAEFGGGGRPPVEQIVVDQELAAAGAPEFVNVVGLDVLGPSLLRFGTDEQRTRYVPPILSAEEIWCQGFSEPEAGSDLASLRTRAVQDGDTFVINGQKTWVSWGQYATWCGVLARTDESVPRHRGISMLIVDMSSAGVEVRPMTQITGHAEFCELFLDDVVVPRGNLLGQLGDGWKIAMHTLGHERGTAALPRQVKLRTWLDRAVSVAARRVLDGQSVLESTEAQTALARALIGIEVLRHHAYRTVGEFLNGGAVGPESSSVKLLMAEAEQRLASTVLQVLGPTLLHGDPDEAAENDFWYETYLYSRAASVYGGTQQIQRDIIADRILSLPKE
ncbi:MAG TPA: acyl-CoA dehydrogenase family protein [Solirubrobacteraceae bacterium]|nr:acyl-CoA dehydrogenase family protein [Solirubrobacteraceae bacterium]